MQTFKPLKDKERITKINVAKTLTNIRKKAIRHYAEAVRNGSFPAPEHCY